MLNRRAFLSFPAIGLAYGAGSPERVTVMRVPGGGVQPQSVVDSAGTVHMVYLQGDAAASDVYYTYKKPGAREFAKPAKLNQQPGSAIGAGTVRGAHLALGRNNRLHILWNGSQTASPKAPGGGTPLLYTTGETQAGGFAAERSLMQFTGGLDGGGALTADPQGNVFAFWHSKGKQPGEPFRRVYLAASQDDGRNFSRERAINSEPVGVCGCCGMAALTVQDRQVYALYRAATGGTHRPMRLLHSANSGQDFQDTSVQAWDINACPMSTASFTAAGTTPVFAWETAKQVYFAPKPGVVIAAPGEGPNRKHPAIARQSNGELLLAWTEGTAWKRGGSLVWQRFDAAGQPLGAPGRTADLPVWGLPAAVAEPDGRFTLIY